MKQSKNEEDYVRMHELQARLARLEEEQQAQSQSEKTRLKALHWMHCPKCGQPLASEEYHSVEIDVCPSCKGVWLDAGELETIVAKRGSLFRACLCMIRGGGQTAAPLAPKRAAAQPG